MPPQPPQLTPDFLPPTACAQIIQLIDGYAQAAQLAGLSKPAYVIRHDSLRTEVAVRALLPTGNTYDLPQLRRQMVAATTKIFNTVLIYPEFMILQANRPGDQHTRHADNTRFNPAAQRWVPNHTPQRVVSSGLYLNQCNVDYTGGELVFPTLGQEVAPSPGLLVAFPSDERYEHEVRPIRSGTRYSILLWYTADPLQMER